MKKLIVCMTVLLFCLCLAVPRYALAEEIEVLRGEEAEEEIFLEGTEGVYSMTGRMTAETDFAELVLPEEENSLFYQAIKLLEDGSEAKLLLSERGTKGWEMKLKLRVKGVRIGTGTISFADMVMTDENGEWLTGVELPDITVKVLPNPLIVNLYGSTGEAGWYVSEVGVEISDKDAAQIWYSLNDGEKKEYTEGFTIGDGRFTITAFSDDGYGYRKEETRYVSVDTVAPELSVDAESLEWQAEDIVLTAGFKDGNSGLSVTGYAFSEKEDCAGSMEYMTSCVEEKELTQTADGIRYLHLYGKDMAGNEAEAVYGPYKKDSVAPEIRFENLTEGCLIEEAVLPKLEITDDRSGIKEITFTLDGEAWEAAEITDKGKHTLTVTAEDAAGNRTTECVTFSVYHKISVKAEASDTPYTHTASFSALVAYRGEPVDGVEVEFLVNGENIDTRRTEKDGRAHLYWPAGLSPQEAELMVRVAQDDESFLLAGEDTDTFTVKQEKAWLIYTGDHVVRKGEPLHLRFETGELPDYRHGDITKAELFVTLYRTEEDGGRTKVEEILLNPDKRGILRYDFYGDTGLYEMKAEFTEESFYTAPGITLYPAVYEVEAELSVSGGSLLIDLPQAGFYLRAEVSFLPPDIEAEVKVQLPGTGITLTEHRLDGYRLDTEGLVLYGSAMNPKDGSIYSYEIKTEFSYGFLLSGIQTGVWKGADREGTPLHTYTWRLEDILEELQEEEEPETAEGAVTEE